MDKNDKTTKVYLFMVYVIIVLVFALVIYLFTVKPLIENIMTIKQNSLPRRLGDIANYDESKRTLTVNKRSELFGKILKIKKHTIVSLGHKDDEYVFTSATVGGITTGGVHKNKGYDYVSSTSKTDRYELRIEDMPIKIIELSDELFELAKESEIAPYLFEGNKSITVVYSSMPSKVAETLINAKADLYLIANQVSQDSVDDYPTYDKCIKIVNWLSAIDI